MLKLLAFLCISMGLYAEAEYEIILLAPKGQEVTDSKINLSYALNESGYVWSTFPCSSPTIYHESFGTKTIPNVDENDTLRIDAVNNQGIAVGVFKSSNKDRIGMPSPERIFAYDVQKEEYYDLYDDLNKNEKENYFYGSDNVTELTISDSNQIFYKKNWSSPLYTYNFNEKTEKSITNSYYAMNEKGQMIGINNDSFNMYGDSNETGETWFFDLSTFHKLGSLDQFNRWSVQPEVLSQNGFVAGKGFDTYRERKIFTWDITSGLNEIDLPEDDVEIKAINDNGQLLGSMRIWGKRHSHYQGFIFSSDLGFIGLGTLHKGDSYPNAINNKGQVVGYSNGKAFIWDTERGMRDLNHLISEDVSGWKNLSVATSINDSGLILGSGNYYGVDRDFLLVPKN